MFGIGFVQEHLIKKLVEELIMTLFERIEAIEPALKSVQDAVAALQAAPASVDQTAAIAAVKAEVDALAALVGTPAA